MEAVERSNLPLENLSNFDQTMVRLVSPNPKTISPIGVNEVNVVHPPGEKEGFTIGLTIRANGTKEPAIVVFKGAMKTGVLSAGIMSKLKSPHNVIVKSTRSAWWNEGLDNEWIKATFSEDKGRQVLIRDQASSHKTESSKILLEERNVQEILIPAGMTRKLQPLDVSVNKPCKTAYKAEYHKWRRNHRAVTGKGYLRKPNRQDLLDMISAAWVQVSPAIVKKSFVVASLISDEFFGSPVSKENNDFGLEELDTDESQLGISFFDENILDGEDDGENEL